jgi:hypothetical protein
MRRGITEDKKLSTCFIQYACCFSIYFHLFRHISRLPPFKPLSNYAQNSNGKKQKQETFKKQRQKTVARNNGWARNRLRRNAHPLRN